jgi:nucleoside-diphosphate-sugar epimerase
MKILIIGGTGFIGPHVVRELDRMGHSVSIFHRGSTPTDLPAESILGDRRDLAAIRPKADVVVDLILSSGVQAKSLMETFRGIARRVVAASSIDVYRACGVLHGSEEGPLEPVPLTEDSPLRTKLQTYPPAQIKMLQKIFGWLDDEYDKIPVERAILSDPDLSGTVLRLPMIYGPGDHLRRFHPVLRRIDDGRRAILFEEGWAAWRTPRGYVENVAAALALAAVDDRAAGRVYNVAETPAFSELDWARKIAAAATNEPASAAVNASSAAAINASAHATAWPGEFIVLPRDRMPPHLVQPGNSAQHWEADSTRIRRELGYKEPIPLDEAIRRTIDWERSHPPPESLAHKFDYAAEDAAIATLADSR